MRTELKQLAAVGLVLVLPVLLSRDAFLSFILTMIILNAILAMSLNLLAGYTGLVNLAVGGLAGFGGYASAYLVMRTGLSFWAALPVAGLVAAAVGLALGFPSIRIKGLYFAITTLMIQILLTQVFVQWTDFTRGDIGLSSIPPPTILLGNLELRVTGTAFAYLVLIVLIVWAYVVRRIVSSKMGLSIIAIRDDDLLASYLGVDTTRQKMAVFFISSFMAGIYGSLLAHLTTFFSPRVVDIFLSVSILAMVLVGGAGTFWGPVVGAALLTALPSGLVFVYPFRSYINGLVLILATVLFPGGIIGAAHKIRPRPRSILR